MVLDESYTASQCPSYDIAHIQDCYDHRKVSTFDKAHKTAVCHFVGISVLYREGPLTLALGEQINSIVTAVSVYQYDANTSEFDEQAS